MKSGASCFHRVRQVFLALIFRSPAIYGWEYGPPRRLSSPDLAALRGGRPGLGGGMTAVETPAINGWAMKKLAGVSPPEKPATHVFVLHRSSFILPPSSFMP